MWLDHSHHCWGEEHIRYLLYLYCTFRESTTKKSDGDDARAIRFTLVGVPPFMSICCSSQSDPFRHANDGAHLLYPYVRFLGPSEELSVLRLGLQVNNLARFVTTDHESVRGDHAISPSGEVTGRTAWRYR